MDKNTAIEVSARIWCDPEYPYIMNTDLAMKIADMLFEEANVQEKQERGNATVFPE